MVRHGGGSSSAGGNSKGGIVLFFWFLLHDGDEKTCCGDGKKKTSFILNLIEVLISIGVISAFAVFLAQPSPCVCHVSSVTRSSNGFVNQYPMAEWEVVASMLYMGYFLFNTILLCTVMPPTSAHFWIIPFVALRWDTDGKFDYISLCGASEDKECCCPLHGLQTCCDGATAIMMPENHPCDNKCCHPWRCFISHVHFFWIAGYRLFCFGLSVYMFVELIRSNRGCDAQCAVVPPPTTRP